MLGCREADAAVKVGGGEAGLQTDRIPHALARSVTCHGNIQSVAESGGGRETAACSKQHCLKRIFSKKVSSRWQWGRGENPRPVSKRSAITSTSQ